MDFIKTVKRYPAWFGAILCFFLINIPLGVAQFWPVLVRDKTIPEWLAEKGGPSIMTLAAAWLLLSIVLSVGAYVIIATISSRNETRSADEQADTQMFLGTTRAEFQEVERQWSGLSPSQKELVGRIYAAGELSWQQIDDEYKKGLLPTYIGEPMLIDHLLERSTLLECDNPTSLWSLKYSEKTFLTPNPKWKIRSNLREAVGQMIRKEESS